jgi:prolyl oligopeptidase PreP (S9A serine peptidase family)
VPRNRLCHATAAYRTAGAAARRCIADRQQLTAAAGGFDIPIKPGFIGVNLAWLEHGGVLVYANIRGGNENG